MPSLALPILRLGAVFGLALDAQAAVQIATSIQISLEHNEVITLIHA